MLPGSNSLLYPATAEGYSVIYPDEHESLPILMRLYADAFSLATQIGFLGSRLRQEKLSVPFSEFNARTKEIADLRQALNRLWEATDVAYWYQRQDSLPRRSKEILQQVSSLQLRHFLHCFPILIDYPPSQQLCSMSASCSLIAACGLASGSNPNSPLMARSTTTQPRSCASPSRRHTLVAPTGTFWFSRFSSRAPRRRRVASR